MNRYDVLSLIVLLVFVVSIPVYAANEPLRLQGAQENLRQQNLQQAAVNYAKFCSTCHGVAGQGLGVTPPLNNPAFKEANADDLFTTIARAGHGTGMAAWHMSEGGVLNDYQIEQLVTLIQHADWKMVGRVVLDMGLGQMPVSADQLGEAFMWAENSDDPHSCISCHEEPLVHAGEFGVNCARCHNSVAWTPAVLTKHTFFLDHGGEGQLECNTCHVENYSTNTCFECHDHQPDAMQQVHAVEEKLATYDDCMACHPTGQPGEAAKLMDGKLIDLSMKTGNFVKLP